MNRYDYFKFGENMNINVKFTDVINYNNNANAICSFIEDYFYIERIAGKLNGRKLYVINHTENEMILQIEPTSLPSWKRTLVNICKLASYFTVLIPLCALIVRESVRYHYKFQLKDISQPSLSNKKEDDIHFHKTISNVYDDISTICIKVQGLIDKGADINEKDEDGWAPLHNAATKRDVNGYHLIALLISNGANVNVKNSSGDTPLHLAASNLGSRYVRSIMVLLNQGAKIDERNTKQQTPLHGAALDLFSTALITDLLLENGAEINAKDIKGQTPLHLACQTGNSYIVEHLIDSGADVNVRDSEGRTPLHFACEYELDCNIKYLIDNGADINIKDSSGNPPKFPPSFDKNKETPFFDPFKIFSDRLCGKSSLKQQILEEKEIYYKALGLLNTASAIEIRKAYKKFSLKYHPDKIIQQEGESIDNFKQRQNANIEKFKEINEAYHQLCNS